MNNQGDEHQALDMGLLRYSSNQISVPHASNATPDKMTKDPKDVLGQDSNPADIYLYDQPDGNSRRNGHERPLETQQLLTAATSNYSDDKNMTHYTNNTSSRVDSNHDGSNESPHGVNYSVDNDNNMDLQSTLTPLKLRDRRDHSEDNNHRQDLESDRELPTAASHESSVPANQEMQSADTLLTRTSLDTRGGNEGSDSVEQPFYVNAKQYYRILKRRYTRAKLEENLRISRERRPYLHESRHKHAMRRPRGQGGRFLTLAEIDAMKSKEGSTSSGSSASSPPNIKNESDQIRSGPPLIERQGPKPKKLKPADSSNR